MMQLIYELKDRNEILFYFGLVFVVGAAVAGVMAANSSVQVLGVNVWYKPLKFLLSSILFVWTMGWFLGYLPNDRSINIYSWVMVGLFLFENIYIFFQAARGQQSHFNVSTPFYSFMWGMMGLAATLISVATGIISIKFFQFTPEQINIGFWWGIRLGIILFVIFSMEGIAMGARMSHTVGAPDGGEGIPFLNWSKKNGDLRVAHFIGMHALQVVPFLSFFLTKNITGAIIIATLYGALSVYTFVRALM